MAFALAGLIPLAIGLASMISRRVFQMFNFTLAQSARGVRVTRGLFNLTSQSIPVNRIQGVRVIQPILWRRLGWYRIDVNVLGYGSSEGSDNDTAATSVLVPVADRRDVEITLSRILPGLDLAAVELHASPRRAKWLRPYDFWTLRYGTDDRVVVTEHGWLTHVRNIVPARQDPVRPSQPGSAAAAARTGRRPPRHHPRARDPDRAPAGRDRRSRAVTVPARPGPRSPGPPTGRDCRLDLSRPDRRSAGPTTRPGAVRARRP